MGSQIECFLITETEFVRRDLRRFVFTETEKCPGSGSYGYHNAAVVIEPKLLKPREGKTGKAIPNDLIPHSDPRWPAACEACGYSFQPEDEWQVNDHRLYENVERGILTAMVWDEVPPGAMWWADWLDSHGSRYWEERGGGPHLLLQTPAGLWDIDQKSSNGEGWTRTGEPPVVTANPSILIQGTNRSYHGWLRAGVLVEC